MSYQFPHAIESHQGESLVFERIETDADGDRVVCSNTVVPNAGPPMHVHFQQDESLTVVSGKMGYQVLGQAPQYAGPGETVLFERGVAHRFWNAGAENLHCTGWVKPANSIVFFLSSIYAARNKNKTERPELFDGAYLMYRYRREYDMPEIPGFVKKVVFPAVYGLGKLLGKYRKFHDAPAPL